MANAGDRRRVLIDTTALIGQLRKGPSASGTELERASLEFDDLLITAVTAYELESGAKAAGRESDLASLIPVFEIVPITSREAEEAAAIYAEQHRLGSKLESPDAIVAGTARLHGFPLLTANLKHFAGIASLVVDESVESLVTKLGAATH